jgi:hypothetical protein
MTIKALRILFPISYKDLTNLPIGLEILFVPHADIEKDQVVDLNLPCTLNILYVHHTLVNNIRVPYGCKIEGITLKIEHRNILIRQDHRRCKVLKEIRTKYTDNEILSISNYKHFYRIYLKK